MTVAVSVHIDSKLAAPIVTRWEDQDLTARLWAKDPTVWFDPPRPETANRLGWLDLPSASRDLEPLIDSLARDARAEGITDIVLCGMGGSSLAPEVFAATLPAPENAPVLTVIDSTHPDAVAAVSASTSPSTTWYVVSSKSGGTLETLSLFRHFWSEADDVLEDTGSHFIAVTDPGSSLAALAAERNFRAVVLADPDVGGRYSALTAFGLVPAGLVGADVGRLLDSAAAAARACGPDVPAAENPGVLMGAAFGTASGVQVPTLYFDATAPATALPIWIEQLVAESTGKEDRGILPVAGGGVVPGGEATIVSIGSSPHEEATVLLRFDDPYDIGGAMFLLEFATAVAGEVISIQPFDQPDVQLAKTLAHEAMEGRLDASGPDPVSVAEAGPALTESLQSAGYVSIQAYLAPTPETDELLDRLASAIAMATDRYVTIGYGPRFLHSTGQLHKGGPAGGVFLQLLDEPQRTVPVPETDFTFNELVAAQATGDRAALFDRRRIVVAVDLGQDPDQIQDLITTVSDR